MSTRRPDPRPARTRTAILAALSELVVEQGIAETTIGQVASRAGVAIGTIYTHFGSKDGLVLELVWSRAAPALEAFEQDRPGLPPGERVAALGDAILRFALDEPVSFGVLVGGAGLPDDLGQHPAGLRLMEAADRVGAQVQQDLEAAIALGTVPEAPVDELSTMLVGMWIGLAGAAARGDRFALSEPLAWRALQRSAALLA